MALVANGAQALTISDLSDEKLVLYREAVLEHKRLLLDELSERQRAIEAELQARMERNGGRALVAQGEGVTYKVELSDQYTPYVYDVAGLRDVAKKLPPSEAAKIVKHIEEQITVVPAHDEPGNPRSITALIKQYGENSEIGKALLACMQRTKVGTKLTITGERA